MQRIAHTLTVAIALVGCQADDERLLGDTGTVGLSEPAEVCFESSSGAGLDTTTGEFCPSESPIGYSLLGPNVHLVVDLSGSMAGARWEELQGLLPWIPAVGARANLGLSVFPDPGSVGCAVTEDGKLVPILNGLDAIAPVTEALSGVHPGGSTPLGYAVRRLREDTALQCPNRDNVVVVLTDGVESCGGDPASEIESLAEDGPEPVEVYIVGFGVSPATAGTLETLASAAAATTPSPNFYAVDSADQLVGRLQEVTGTCRVQLDEAVSASELTVSMDGRTLSPCSEDRCEEGFTFDETFQTVQFEGSDCLNLLDGACHELNFDAR